MGTPNQILLDRIRGSMVGAVLGDCLGSPVECTYWYGIKKKSVRQNFDAYKDDGTKLKRTGSLMKFTDDTAMARQVALSIIDKKELDAKDLATRFVKEYKTEPWRGYGGSVGQVFEKLEKTKFASEKEVFLPASEQFDGAGSYGNGAAMRAHPIGLFGNNIEEVEIMAEKQAKLTHAHDGGIMGSILQATAVHLALHQTVAKDMIDQLATSCEKWEKAHPPNSSKNVVNEKDDEDEGDSEDDDIMDVEKRKQSYTQQLKTILNLLNVPYKDENQDKIVKDLGNDIASIRSAPTALFSFLKAQKPIEGFCETNEFQRTLEVAMSFGGDSDTIMSMAGAIAGAYYGQSNIPKYLMNVCEGVEDAQHQAEEIFKLLEYNNVNSS